MSLKINNREISDKESPYLVAEISGNHGQQIKKAKELIKVAAQVGADAVKLQTYRPEILTLDIRNEYFKKRGGLWDGKYLYDLYGARMTPWEWVPELDDYAKECGITLFSTPYDETAVDFLESTICPPAYKISSYEVTHLPLLKKVGSLRKPVIMSSGLASEREIKRALRILKRSGAKEIMLLKCVNGYPLEPDDYNLRSIGLLKKKFGCLVGLSDHSLGHEICLGAVALGACLIEKHLILNRSQGGIDAGFSLEPEEFATMAEMVATLHRALGEAKIGASKQEDMEIMQRRSIFVAKAINPEEVLTAQNLRIVRPGHGMCPSKWERVVGRRAKRTLNAGEPLRKGDWY